MYISKEYKLTFYLLDSTELDLPGVLPFGEQGNIINLITGPERNSYFCFPKNLDVS